MLKNAVRVSCSLGRQPVHSPRLRFWWNKGLSWQFYDTNQSIGTQTQVTILRSSHTLYWCYREAAKAKNSEEKKDKIISSSLSWSNSENNLDKAKVQQGCEIALYYLCLQETEKIQIFSTSYFSPFWIQVHLVHQRLSYLHDQWLQLVIFSS